MEQAEGTNKDLLSRVQRLENENESLRVSAWRKRRGKEGERGRGREEEREGEREGGRTCFYATALMIFVSPKCEQNRT